MVALRATHEADSYPLNWPDDPRAWLDPPGLERAWVAVDADGTVAGHVAVDEHGELIRLFVAPAARRRSVATGLVEQVAGWAREHGRRLTLNVVADDQRSGAAAFYEARGFAHTHDVEAGWSGPDGRPVTLRYYALG